VSALCRASIQVRNRDRSSRSAGKVVSPFGADRPDSPAPGVEAGSAVRVSTAALEEVAIAAVQIGTRRRNRQRPVESLMRSINAHGLIHPIVVNENNELVAGHGRLEACRRLGWTISARRVADLSEDELRAIELDENIEREPLTPAEASAERLAQIRQAQADARRDATQPASNFEATPPRKSRGRATSFAAGTARPTHPDRAVRHGSMT